MNTPDIDEIMKRTASYVFEDGIGEIYWGFLLILIGLLFFVDAVWKPPIRSFSAIGLALLSLGGYRLGRWLVPAIKRRLTFPRTGFVAYRQLSGTRRWMAMGITVLVASVIAAVVSVLGVSGVGYNWIPLADGLVAGAFLVYLGSQVGLRRFQLLAGFSGLAAVAIFLSGLGDTLGSAAYFAAMGLALTVSGSLVLWAYLHQTPRPEEQ